MNVARLQFLLCAELKRQLGAGATVHSSIPAGGELLWKWFIDLHKVRRMGYAAPEPISYAEVISYGEVMRWPIEPRHIGILLTMDRAYLEAYAASRRQAPDGVKSLPFISPTPMTAGMIDAMFG